MTLKTWLFRLTNSNKSLLFDNSLARAAGITRDYLSYPEVQISYLGTEKTDRQDQSYCFSL